MFNITWRELKDRKWSLLSYAAGSLLMLWIYVATFKSSVASTQQLQELIKTYPKALIEAIGLSNLSINTIEPYLNVKHFSLVWPLLAIILALSRAGNQIAGEIQNGTIGLLLDQPLERWRIFAAKYLSGFITIIAFTGVSVFAVIPLAKAYGIATNFHILFMAWILTTLFMWAIYAISLMVSALVSEKGHVYAIMGGVLLGSYVLNIIALIEDKLTWMKNYSLFYYFNTQKVLAGGSIGGRNIAVFVMCIVVASLIGLWRFNKRDISV